jgi:glycosyltransferase involved in cell wall biosynthesis
VPKVSVIIPTYNRAHLISETIKSVLDQTFQDFEIVVIDDGSTDNTREVVDSFQDPRIRYIYQDNQGAVVARNNAILASKGEYISYLDSDDALMENALEKHVEVLDRHPEVAFSYGQVYNVDENGRIINLYKPPYKHSYVREGKEEIRDLIFGNYISAETIRRSCLDEAGGFDTAFIVAEDRELWVRLAKRWSVAYIAEPLIKYRRHTSSIMSTIGIEKVERSHILILEEIFTDEVMGPLFSRLRPSAYSNLYFQLGGSYYNRRDMKKSRQYLYLAMKTYPKGFLNIRSLFHWMIQFIKTWLPVTVLAQGRRANLYVRKAIWQKMSPSHAKKRVRRT